MHHFDDIYPFSAIVGQEQMKKALLLNAINPRIGGVLIKGEKGTAKSTAARALARLLPDKQVVDGCTCGCDPSDSKRLCPECWERVSTLTVKTTRMKVIELPISATEDKVVGSLDIEYALKKGERKFEPGVLAKAHRNILYVDEVNLLNDHIVDVLLDAAAMGMNIIEREGVSYVHPSEFILIGTMNPEEGELRPQLLDRFGLCVDIVGIDDADTRVEVVRRRQAYEQAPGTFIESWQEEEQGLRERIVRAKELLPEVSVSEEMLAMIAQICIDMAVDGHRADIVMLKTAATIAAFNGRKEVTEEDVREAAELVLSHRMRRQPFSDQQMDKEKVEQSIEKSQQEKKQPEQQQQNPENQKPKENTTPDGSTTTQFAEGQPFKVNQKPLATPRRIDSFKRDGSGRRSVTESRDGKYVRSRIPETIGPDIALDATIRAAAPHQKDRKGPLAVKIESSDLREKVRERKMGNTVLFVVDASGSMGAQQRMTAVKGAILSLLIDAYQKRDRVGLVVFRGKTAEVLLPPTSSVELARKYMQQLPVGGKTPLAHGLSKAFEVLQREKMINRHTIPRLILISDGKANVSRGSGSPLDDANEVAARIKDAGISSLVIDSEKGYIAFGLAQTLSQEMGAKYLKLEDLQADQIADVVKGIGM
ncbi:putative cobaltochelatase [Methanoregula formicica]|uniref:magnesium chelatase n=1 Tax=Methanoregula formicica (strain DSM 22288 / NBRC 105244 / SMSP) TaxID=593750 RepID=L0HFS5_METFS|nr:putative cobaltochelatase [Methanoregula formicica]AGB01939.1 magnesium chelatase ATPase subunit D [Methanoregula formicica SMSP]